MKNIVLLFLSCYGYMVGCRDISRYPESPFALDGSSLVFGG